MNIPFAQEQDQPASPGFRFPCIVAPNPAVTFYLPFIMILTQFAQLTKSQSGGTSQIIQIDASRAALHDVAFGSEWLFTRNLLAQAISRQLTLYVFYKDGLKSFVLRAVDIETPSLLTWLPSAASQSFPSCNTIIIVPPTSRSPFVSLALRR